MNIGQFCLCRYAGVCWWCVGGEGGGQPRTGSVRHADVSSGGWHLFARLFASFPSVLPSSKSAAPVRWVRGCVMDTTQGKGRVCYAFVAGVGVGGGVAGQTD